MYELATRRIPSSTELEIYASWKREREQKLNLHFPTDKDRKRIGKLDLLIKQFEEICRLER